MFRSFADYLQNQDIAPDATETGDTPTSEDAVSSETEAVDFAAAVEETIDSWVNDGTSANLEDESANNDEDVSDVGFADDENEDEDEDVNPNELEEPAPELPDEEIDRLWEQIVSEFGIDISDSLSNTGADTESLDTSSSDTAVSTKNEIVELKEAIRSLSEWQTAVQQYLQTSVEAENIRQVAQQLAGLGVILPDEQIQEIARLSQQLNIPPSVLLKAKAYDYTMQQIQQDERAPFPFMNPPRPPAPNILPNARPFQETADNAQKRTGFTGFHEFLKQMGITEE